MKRFFKPFHVLFLLAAATIVGCAVNQDKEVANYRKVIDGQAPTTRPFASKDPLTLQQALLLANWHNEQLSIQGENYLQALIDKDRAFSAFLPNIALVPTYYIQDHGSSASGSTATGSNANSVQTHRLDVPVNGQINIFNGFRDVANQRRAGFTAEQQQQLLVNFQNQILLETAQVYYQILRSEQSVVVLRNSLDLQVARVKDIQSRQRAGLARALDVAQTQATESSTRVQLIQAENDVHTGRATLATLTGMPVIDSPLTDAFPVPANVPSRDAIIQQAMDQRQDLRAALLASEAANQSVKIAVGEYYPSLSVNANYFLSRESFPTDSDWNALLTANVPIFAAGQIHQNVRFAWSSYRQAKLNESLTRRTVLEQSRNAWDNLTSNQKRLSELQTQLVASQEAFRQAEQGYRVGLATNLDYLTAQDQLLSTQLQLTSATYDVKLFYLDLIRATGSLDAHSPHSPLMANSPTTQPLAVAH